MSEEIYDCGPSSEAVTDIKTLKQRFEQQSAPKPKPVVKPKPTGSTSNTGGLPRLPPKSKDDSKPPPTLPKTTKPKTNLDTKETKSNPGKTNNANVTILQKRISGLTKVDKENVKRLSEAATVVGIDGKVYKRLVRPTPATVGPPPKQPRRPQHILLPDYAANECDDDELYDDVGVALPNTTTVRPISMIPDMTEEEELGPNKKPKPEEYEPEDYDDIMTKDQEGEDDDIYETFDEEENAQF